MRRSTDTGFASPVRTRTGRLRARLLRVAATATATAVGAVLVAGTLVIGVDREHAPVGPAAVAAPLADAPCDEVRQLLVVASGLDRSADAAAGSASACIDRARERVLVRNDTPVVWVVAGTVTLRGAVREAVGAPGLVASAWYRSGRGVAVPPGSTAVLELSGAPMTALPDLDATRFYLAVAAMTRLQESRRQGAVAPRSPRSAVAAAALTCGRVASSDSRAEGDAEPPTSGELAQWLRRAGADVGCSTAWMRAGLLAQADGWSLPPLAEAFASPAAAEDPGLDRARAWYAASGAYSYRQ